MDNICLKNKKLLSKIKSIGLLLLPVVLYFVPIDRLNNLHSICIFKNIFGRECYGCGITRAVLSAIQFNFENAYHYSKFVVFVFPLLVYLWTKMLWQLFELKTHPRSV